MVSKMDVFSQSKYLKFSVIILILLNLILISFYFVKDYKQNNKNTYESNKPKNESKDVSSILERELNLTNEQSKQINELRNDFFKQEKVLAKKIRGFRDSMNINMFNKETDEEKLKYFAKCVADNEYQMELLRIEQARKFKLICNQEQREKFESLVREIKDYFKPKKPPKY